MGGLQIPLVFCYHTKRCKACISALEQGQWEQVLCLFHRLMISGLQPSITTCNALITACASEEWPRALTTLPTLPSLKLRADIVTFNACIRACDEGGQWERALLLFSEAQRRRLQPSAVTYSSIITACAGRWLGSLVEPCPKCYSLSEYLDLMLFGKATSVVNKVSNTFKLFWPIHSGSETINKYHFFCPGVQIQAGFGWGPKWTVSLLVRM